MKKDCKIDKCSQRHPRGCITAISFKCVCLDHFASIVMKRDLVEHYIPNFQRMNRNQKFDILLKGIDIENPEIISTNITLTKAVKKFLISSKRFS